MVDLANNERKMLQTWLNMSNKRVVVVVFSAPWSGATHILNTYLNSLKSDFPSLYTDYVDIEKSDKLANEFGIRQVPTMVIIRNSEIKDYTTGTMSRTKLRLWIEPYV